MEIVVRADGGPNLGYGHLVRTSALATRLLALGHDVTYATTTPAQARETCPDGISVTELTAQSGPEELIQRIYKSVDVTIIDSYEADVEYQKRVRRETPLVVITDDTRHAVSADVVVNGNIYATELSYDFQGDSPKWCLGPEYVLLRDEIAELAERRLPWRDPPERAIVTMGGSDVANATPDAVRAFDGTGLRVDVVVGPGFSNEAEIRDVADGVTADTRVVRDPPNLPELMFEADFAVGACGSTTYELLALGTPLVCSPVVENQERIASALSERDAATVVDETNRRRGFRRGVTRYIDEPDIRREHRDRGSDIVDGRGTERVCAELLSMADENAVS